MTSHLKLVSFDLPTLLKEATIYVSDKVIIIFDRVFQSSSKYNKVLVNKKVFIKAKISFTFDDDDDTSRNAKVRFLMHLIKEYFV